MKQRINKFRTFERMNEQEEQTGSNPLRGYSAEIAIKRIEEMMEIMPDRVKFGVPADNKGYSLSYRDANGAIQKIRDIQHYYSGKGEDVTFYCWNISYAGSWDATKSLREKIDEFGGFGREMNINLKKVISYFNGNAEDVDNVRSFSISIDTLSIRKDSVNQEKKPEGSPQPDSAAEPRKEEVTAKPKTEE